MDNRHHTQNDSPEQLLDVFKAAALSVTKLYKSSVAAEVKARTDGYQDCLDDLTAFLDREGPNLLAGDGGLQRLRKWAAERREGRELSPQTSESDEDTEKPTETMATINAAPAAAPADNVIDSARSAEPARPVEFVVPSRESFTFQADHPYPNIELLDLSERSHGNAHSGRQRRTNKTAPRLSGPLGRGAGSKRRIDFDDLFGGCFGGKDFFGGGGKRSRHT